MPKKLKSSPEQAVKYHLEQIQSCYQCAVENAWLLGGVLNEQKKKLLSGEWQEWLSEYFPQTERTATTYMRLNTEMTKEAAVNAGSIRQAQKLLTKAPNRKRASDHQETKKPETPKEIAKPSLNKIDENDETDEYEDDESLNDTVIMEPVSAPRLLEDIKQIDKNTAGLAVEVLVERFPVIAAGFGRVGNETITFDEVVAVAYEIRDQQSENGRSWPKQGTPEDTAESFLDHFNANGWKVAGKAKMKNWVSALRNFGKNQFGAKEIGGLKVTK